VGRPSRRRTPPSWRRSWASDFDIAEYSYDVLPEALVTGQADIVGAELFVTDERKKLVDFSSPYYQSGQLFYVLKSSAVQDDRRHQQAQRSLRVWNRKPRSSRLAQKYVSEGRRSATHTVGQEAAAETTSSALTEPTRRCHRPRR